MISILEILYIVLIIFSSIIGTLLVIILMRVIKILGPIMEIAEFYNKIKSVISGYKHIPEIVKEKIHDLLSSNEKK